LINRIVGKSVAIVFADYLGRGAAVDSGYYYEQKADVYKYALFYFNPIRKAMHSLRLKSKKKRPVANNEGRTVVLTA